MCHRYLADTSRCSYLITCYLRWDAEISLQLLSWLSFPLFLLDWLRKRLILLVSVISLLLCCNITWLLQKPKGLFHGSMLCTLSGQNSFSKGKRKGTRWTIEKKKKKWKKVFILLHVQETKPTEFKSRPEMLSLCGARVALHCGAFTDTLGENTASDCAQHGTCWFESCCFCQLNWCWKCWTFESHLCCIIPNRVLSTKTRLEKRFCCHYYDCSYLQTFRNCHCNHL